MGTYYLHGVIDLEIGIARVFLKVPHTGAEF